MLAAERATMANDLGTRTSTFKPDATLAAIKGKKTIIASVQEFSLEVAV